jgi:hypothetical protein
VPEMMVPRDRILVAAGYFKRLRRSNAPEAQHGDFQSKFLKVQKYFNFNQLILLNLSTNFRFRLELFENI